MVTPRRLAYEPAFDGLRGAAVFAVLLFHGGFSWASGGFLGVSTFFTLSGFLITSLLLAEHDGSGRVSLRRFYTRRVRRLWPASCLTLVLVALYAATGAGPTQLVGLRADMTAALFDVSNWWFIHEGRSYGALFRAPSLVQHYWSLAIEEQFYLVVPPLLALLFTRTSARARRATVVVVAMALSAAWTLVLDRHGVRVDRIYYGSETRAFELLAGVLLAVLVHGRSFGEAGRARVVGLGAAALGASVAAWALVHQADPWLYRGGLWLYAGTSVCVVLACREDGLARTALAWKPLVLLGEISYGVYLLHWPIFQWLTPGRLGLALGPTFLVRLSVTLGAALLSAYLLEQPIRHGGLGRTGRRWLPWALGLTSFAAVMALILTVVPVPAPGFDIDKASAELARVLDEPVTTKIGAPVVATFGDSTALSLDLGLADWNARTGQLRLTKGDMVLGCGLLDEGLQRGGTKDAYTVDLADTCPSRRATYRGESKFLDYGIVMFGPWDVVEHRLPGDDRWRTIGDPVVDTAIRAKFNQVVDDVGSDGAKVLWVLSPPLTFGAVDGQAPKVSDPASDPQRIEHFNRLIREEAAKRPDDVVVLDLPSYLRGQPGGEASLEMRTDGIHFTRVAARKVARQWLWPEIQAQLDARPK